MHIENFSEIRDVRIESLLGLRNVHRRVLFGIAIGRQSNTPSRQEVTAFGKNRNMVSTHSPKGAAHTGSPAVPRRLLLPRSRDGAGDWGRFISLGSRATSLVYLWYTSHTSNETADGLLEQ